MALFQQCQHAVMSSPVTLHSPPSDVSLDRTSPSPKTLRFNPAHRRNKLVYKELDEDGLGKLLAQRWVAPVILFPILENLVEAVR